ncbi:MAG TPA: DUF6152 family protein [Vicinamibacterales bacterium]|nr:DUF6152 family protein [Vicinamibacterales bacterium]
MKTLILGGLFALGVVLAGRPALAHHSFAAEFDADKPITLSGIVTKVEWTNPHVWFYINVKDEKTGQVTNWGAEMGPPHGLQRRGWRQNTLKIGDQITVAGSMAKNGAKRMNASKVTLASTGLRPGETLDAASSGSKDVDQ